MSTITKFIFIAALLLSIVVPTAAFLIGEKNRGRFKTTLGINCFLFFGTMALAVIMIFTGDGSVPVLHGAVFLYIYSAFPANRPFTHSR